MKSLFPSFSLAPWSCVWKQMFEVSGSSVLFPVLKIALCPCATFHWSLNTLKGTGWDFWVARGRGQRHCNTASTMNSLTWPYKIGKKRIGECRHWECPELPCVSLVLLPTWMVPKLSNRESMRRKSSSGKTKSCSCKLGVQMVLSGLSSKVTEQQQVLIAI